MPVELVFGKAAGQERRGYEREQQGRHQ